MLNNKMSIPLIISFLLPGLGIAYLGDVKKGVTIFLVSVICIFLKIFLRWGITFSLIGFLVWALGMYLTYVEVKRL